MQVNLRELPSYNQTHVLDFPRLDGGLNIRELNYRLENDQSPNMKNLWWKDGVLQSRDGQAWLSDDETLGAGYACCEQPFESETVFHIGESLYCADPRASQFVLRQLITGVPENRGTFFRYQDSLYYKNVGGFFRIYHDGTQLAAVSMTDADEAYTPVIVINASPANGSGTTYQPENRLSPKKEVHYNADGTTTVYHLPVADVDAVTKVVVDGVTLVEDTDYTVDLTAGTVTFMTAPDPGNPPANNTVEITYSKANPDALGSIMGCPYAIVAGSGDNLCILLAGCQAQPNAVFWNSNDNLSMNPGYWPMSYYNLCGRTNDMVTGFGMQYNDLILFKTESVGKLIFGIEQVDSRDSISFTYESINARIGCDLPWTIQLIENNLVFCNSLRGVFIVQSSSAAYENNIVIISDNVNGSEYSYGLLSDIRQAAGAVSSVDDDHRYWICANGHVYLWDYSDSTASRPSWYYFSDVFGVCYFRDVAGGLYHLDAQGRVTEWGTSYSDYDGPIDKVYSLPVQYFGGYDRLKDIQYVIVAVRSTRDTEVQLRYDSDYERRVDLTPIISWSWRLAPRNLSHRCLAGHRYGLVAKRVVGAKHVRHFGLTLGNNAIGSDLAIVSVQIFYRYSGKER